MQRGPLLHADDLGLPQPLPAGLPAAEGGTPVGSLDAMERRHLLDALEANHWNVSLAARALQVTRDTLRYRMAKHGLQRAER